MEEQEENNKMSNSVKISTLEGNPDHYQHVMEFERSFQKDCGVFFNRLEQLNDISLKAFTYFYIKYKFSSLAIKDNCSRDALSYYTDSCFAVIRKYLKYSDNFTIKVGALYLLHAIYSQQSDLQNLVKITITHAELKNIIQLVRDVKEQNIPDVLFIFNKLIYEDAFCLSATERTVGVDLLNYWQPLTLENDIYKRSGCAIKSLITSSLKSISNTDSLNEVCLDYDQALRLYEEKTNKTIRMKPECTIVKETAALFEDIKQAVADLDENSSRECDEDNETKLKI